MQTDPSSSGISGLGIGLIIVFGLVYLAIMVVLVWAYVNIIRRAGYSGWWVLIGLVPIANIVFFLMFAFKEWPAQRELKQLRAWAAQAGYGQPGYGQPGYGQQPPGQPGYGPQQPWQQ